MAAWGAASPRVRAAFLGGPPNLLLRPPPPTFVERMSGTGVAVAKYAARVRANIGLAAAAGVPPSLVAHADGLDAWVQCGLTRCGKWRRLPLGFDTSMLDNKWQCSHTAFILGCPRLTCNDAEEPYVAEPEAGGGAEDEGVGGGGRGDDGIGAHDGSAGANGGGGGSRGKGRVRCAAPAAKQGTKRGAEVGEGDGGEVPVAAKPAKRAKAAARVPTKESGCGIV